MNKTLFALVLVIACGANAQVEVRSKGETEADFFSRIERVQAKDVRELTLLRQRTNNSRKFIEDIRTEARREKVLERKAFFENQSVKAAQRCAVQYPAMEALILFPEQAMNQPQAEALVATVSALEEQGFRDCLRALFLASDRTEIRKGVQSVFASLNKRMTAISREYLLSPAGQAEAAKASEQVKAHIPLPIQGGASAVDAALVE